MIDEAERVFDGVRRADLGRLLTLDHDHLDAPLPCGCDLAIGRRATAVLGDDHVDVVPLQQFALGLFLEGAGGEDVTGLGNIERRGDGIDAADDVAMLRRIVEMEGFLPSYRKEDAAGRCADRRNSLGNRGDTGPAVAGLLLPDGTAEREKGDAGRSRRNQRIVRNPRGKGMRRIDQEIKFFVRQESGESVTAAEATAANRDRLGHGLGRAPRQRQMQIPIVTLRQGSRQLPRFRRAAEDQDTVSAHG